MNSIRLQERLDRVRTTSPRRWVLATLAVVAGTLSSGVTAAVSDAPDAWVVVFTAVLGVVSVIESDSPAGSAVIGTVVLQWLVTIDDPSTPWAIVVALALFVFHALVALMAVTPFTAAVCSEVLSRWLRRSGVVSAATVVVWVLVAVVTRWEVGGSPIATVAALALVAGLATAVRMFTRERSTPSPGDVEGANDRSSIRSP